MQNKNAVVLAVVLATFAAPVVAQVNSPGDGSAVVNPSEVTSDTARGRALAQIGRPIAIVNDEDMVFAFIARAPDAQGTLRAVLNQDSSMGGDCGGQLLCAGAPQTGSFFITGDPDANFTITLPTTVELTREGGGATITVQEFTSNVATNGRLDADGRFTLTVAGTMLVTDNQEPGNYTGVYEVSSNY